MCCVVCVCVCVCVCVHLDWLIMEHKFWVWDCHGVTTITDQLPPIVTRSARSTLSFTFPGVLIHGTCTSSSALTNKSHLSCNPLYGLVLTNSTDSLPDTIQLTGIRNPYSVIIPRICYLLPFICFWSSPLQELYFQLSLHPFCSINSVLILLTCLPPSVAWQGHHTWTHVTSCPFLSFLSFLSFPFLSFPFLLPFLSFPSFSSLLAAADLMAWTRFTSTAIWLARVMDVTTFNL